jgi:MerR family transcriptional regulator, light-induced transcriptional regulator
MTDEPTSLTATQGPTSAEAGPAPRRIGAVARMLHMPVATLRVWEQRYGLTQARLSPSGQRLYTADDVRRLALIKQLTELGHAIGSLAPLDMAQLQRVAQTHAGAQATARADAGAAASSGAPRPWRVAVVGAALGARLQRPALLRRLERPVQLLGPFDTVAQAAAALNNADLDALLIHEPQLHAGWLGAVDAVAPALASVPKAVLYGFAADAVCESLASVGVTLLREPQPDAVLAQWLHHCASATAGRRPTHDQPAGVEPSVPPRRWSDAALVDFAGRSTTVACECPRHVAELLVQLAHFERYSAECENRSPADAALHAYLGQVTADARARFEAALERVALHEGLLLPSPGVAENDPGQPPSPKPSPWS